jgi:hypothetical protein
MLNRVRPSSSSVVRSVVVVLCPVLRPSRYPVFFLQIEDYDGRTGRTEDWAEDDDDGTDDGRRRRTDAI